VSERPTPPSEPFQEPAATRLVYAHPGDVHTLALVVKRTHTIYEDGSTGLAEEQLPLDVDSEPWEEVESPLVSPPESDNDLFAFKQRTDVVVQGTAYAYGRPVTETTVELRVRDQVRPIRVRGDRVCHIRNGHLLFSDPEPFAEVPVRYDRAYGGVDRGALASHGDPRVDTMGDVRPEYEFDRNTRFHYPRNPSGTGYLTELDGVSLEGLTVPNLDYPFDPVTPERMVCRGPKDWMAAPLPAGFDWCHQAWFPRIGYLGLTPPYQASSPPREAEYGWAAPDVLESPSILDLKLRPEFAQGASPGLALPRLGPGEEILLRNMWPDRPDRVVRVPLEWPSASVTPKWKQPVELRPQLNAVILRPDEYRMTTVWAAVGQVHRPFSPFELEETPFTLTWTAVTG